MSEVVFFKSKSISRVVTSANKKAVYHFSNSRPSAVSLRQDILIFRGRPAEYIECDRHGNAIVTEMSQRFNNNAPYGAKALSVRVYDENVRKDLEDQRKKEEELKSKAVNKIQTNSLDSAEVTTIFSDGTETVIEKLKTNSLDEVDLEDEDLSKEEVEGESDLEEESSEVEKPKSKRGRPPKKKVKANA